MMHKKGTFFIIFLLVFLALGGDENIFCEEEKMDTEEMKDENVRDPFAAVLPQKEIVYNSTEVKPFEGGVRLPDFSVQGLVWGVDKPQAIIDNKVLNVGDEIEGAKVIEITKEGVKINYMDKIFLIKPEINKETSKKQTGGRNE